jgi:membrane-associated phospholipid phosphatase
MLDTFIAGLVSIIIFSGINYFWKISLHTAFVAASTAVVIIVYGAAAAWACLLLPPVGWARVQLKQHSLAQVVTGSVLAAGIVVGVFAGLGAIG